MFIDHQIGYLDIVKLCDACCEAHMADLVATPNLEEIVHYDQWVSARGKDHAGFTFVRLCKTLDAVHGVGIDITL